MATPFTSRTTTGPDNGPGQPAWTTGPASPDDEPVTSSHLRHRDPMTTRPVAEYRVLEGCLEGMTVTHWGMVHVTIVDRTAANR